MKIYDLIKELKYGKHITRDNWLTNSTIAFVDGFLRLFLNGEISDVTFDLDTLFGTDNWIIVREENSNASFKYIDNYDKDRAELSSMEKDAITKDIEFFINNG